MESASSKLSLLYHNIFDYPLTSTELFIWSTGLKCQITNDKCQIINKNNFYFIKGRQNIVKTRLQNKKYSQKKLLIAKKASILISKIPTVLFVGVTGSLAMMNADKDSDIDLMIITKANTLWTTRLYCYIIIWLNGYKTRHPKSKLEKDKLCINLWLDESDLIWEKKDRNIYTAHEIAQIIPLINKQNIYEIFLQKNKWILDFWPNSVDAKYIGRSISYIGKTKTQYTIRLHHYVGNIRYTFIEKLAYTIQYWYMKSKISREIVTPTRAIFHPNDWGKVVLSKLSS